MTFRRIAALFAVLWSAVALGCGSFGGGGPSRGTGSECIEGDDSHQCEEADT